MTKEKKFVLDSIKMDLLRVINTVGNIEKEVSKKQVVTFLSHADKDFNKISLTEREKDIRSTLQTLGKKLYFRDIKQRLRWAEDIMTIRSRL